VPLKTLNNKFQKKQSPIIIYIIIYIIILYIQWVVLHHCNGRFRTIGMGRFAPLQWVVLTH
jgi:hypothetical protein